MQPDAPPHLPPAVPRRGFPPALVPPLASLAALLITIAYATGYTLIDWGSTGTFYIFFADAAPAVLGSPFAGSSGLSLPFSNPSYFAPFGGYWVIAIPFGTLFLGTALLASLTNTSAGGRIAIGGLTSLTIVVFAVLLTLFAHLLRVIEFGASYELGYDISRVALGAAAIGLTAGLLGTLLSLAIRPPRAVRFL